MSGHPNEELIRRGYDAFSRGDMDTLSDLFAGDAVWHVPGRSPQAGDYQGIDAILGFFAQSLQLSEGTLKIALHDVLANDEHGVGLQHTTAERVDKTLDSDDVLVFHLRDGKATEVWVHPGDQYATDEFWSD